MLQNFPLICLFHGEYTEAAITICYNFQRIINSYWNVSEILGKKLWRSCNLSSKVEDFKLHKWKLHKCSGRCNPVNWFCQTRRNLSIEYLNLNFVTTPKLTPFHSFYAEKVFISCVWLIPVSWVRTRSSLFDTDVLWHILLDLKFSTRSVPVNISNRWKGKMFFVRKCKGSSWKPGNWYIRHRN